MLLSSLIICYSDKYMAESLKISTWNVKGALSDLDRVDAALTTLQKSTADVITLPDAWHEDSEASEPSERKLLVTPGQFREHGYFAIKSTFRENRPDDNFARYGFATLYRAAHPPVTFKEIELGERPAHHLQFKLGRHTLHYISLYFNDQTEHNRLKQVSDLLSHLAAYESEPIVLAGDFNAMHSASTPARLLRSRLSQSTLGRISAFNNTFPRLIEMAEGSTLRRLRLHDFKDAEPHYLATMPARLPLFQLDHFMSRDGHHASLELSQPIRVHHPDLSDHLQLESDVRIKK